MFKRSILIAHLNTLLFRKGRHYLLCLLCCIMLCEDYCLPSQCRSSFIYIEPFCSSRSLYKNTFHRYNEKEAGDFRFYGTYGTLVWAKTWTTHTHKENICPLRDDKCNFYSADNVKMREKNSIKQISATSSTFVFPQRYQGQQFNMVHHSLL